MNSIDLFLLELVQRLHQSPFVTNKYFAAGVILVTAAVLAFVILFVFSLYLKRIASKTETIIDDLIFDKTKKPLFFLVLVYGVKIALLDLGWDGVMSKLVGSVLAITFAFIFLRMFDIIVESWGQTFAKKTDTKLDDVLLPLFHKIGKVVFTLVSLMWVLHIWEINITPYLAGVGLSGIVLGLALQDSLKNILGGINLMMDKTYQLGDKIKLESGEIGKIHDIGLRTTKLVTFDNEVVYIPNGYLANSRVSNFTHPDTKVRGKVEFMVGYGVDVEKVKNLIHTVIVKQIKELAKGKDVTVQFYEMGDFGLKFRVFFWTEHWDKEAGVKMEITQLVYNTLNKAKIEIPYPTQVVHVRR